MSGNKNEATLALKNRAFPYWTPCIKMVDHMSPKPN